MLQVTSENCPVCGGADFVEAARFPELVFQRCRRCGSAWRAAEDRVALGDFSYRQDYFTGKDSPGYDRRFARRVRRARLELLLAWEACAPEVTPRAALDVGCALGYVLEAARQLGLAATGIDVSEYAVAECRARDYTAQVAEIGATGLNDGTFELVTLKHVLEHTPDPRRALAEMRRVLAPGGALFIATPHASYWKARVFPRRYRFFRPDRLGAQHYVYFSAAGLKQLLEASGFTDVRFGRARRLALAVAGGRRGAAREALRSATTKLGEDLLAILPGLRKELVVTARRG